MKPRNFLLAEDDPALSKCLLILLSRYGRAMHAGTVQDAMILLAEHSAWGALIVDLRLPDGSGLEVLATFRSNHATAPAMILTGALDAIAIDRAYDLGAVYITKPVDSARMLRFSSAERGRPRKFERA